MLRNGLASYRQLQQLQTREISLSCTLRAKNNLSVNRQGKIMSKLFGERVTGSKKRWYPTTDATSKPPQHMIFQAKQLSKPGGAGKNTNRRVTVLNKLFMEQISSMLATGGTAEGFLGRGLQLTRVKIAPDFACVNVYWLGTGNPQTDGVLADDLQRSSGILRHELSQLRVMGEVPRINFVQDKVFANMEHVESLLKQINIAEDVDEADDRKIDFQHVENRIRSDLYGGNEQSDKNYVADLPPMRNDVYGLDHKTIVSKILTKMRKTKQAWETHAERLGKGVNNTTTEPTTLKDVQQKLVDADETSSEDFNKFLAKRRERRTTPERKKYRREDDRILIDKSDDFDDGSVAASVEQKRFLHETDFLHEDNDSERKS